MTGLHYSDLSSALTKLLDEGMTYENSAVLSLVCVRFFSNVYPQPEAPHPLHLIPEEKQQVLVKLSMLDALMKEDTATARREQSETVAQIDPLNTAMHSPGYTVQGMAVGLGVHLVNSRPLTSVIDTSDPAVLGKDLAFDPSDVISGQSEELMTEMCKQVSHAAYGFRAVLDWVLYEPTGLSMVCFIPRGCCIWLCSLARSSRPRHSPRLTRLRSRMTTSRQTTSLLLRISPFSSRHALISIYQLF